MPFFKYFPVVNCGNPGSPRNGRTTAHNGFTYAQDVSFNCDDGYVMDGSSLATCQANGYWSKGLPNCLGEIHMQLHRE